MANRILHEARTLQKGLVTLTGKISLNSSAAVTAPASSGSITGITSVSRASAGLYKITLQDQFYDLIGADFVQSEASPGAIVSIRLKSDAILLSTTSPNSISFWTLVGTTPTDVIAALDIYFTLLLKNTTLAR